MRRGTFAVGDLRLRRVSSGLPPGQREIAGFPRYGTDGVRRDPVSPAAASVEIRGTGVETARLDADLLSRLPRRELVADFHCVAGWSTRDLRWEGVLLRDLYAACGPAGGCTHLRACGRDGYRAVLTLEDALADDVLIADRLDGRPLPLEHGGPWRIVSASQYGYKSVKHLCRLELHPREPPAGHQRVVADLALRALGPHPHARVWEEQRHRHVPPQQLRWVYRSVAHPLLYTLNALGALRTRRR